MNGNLQQQHTICENCKSEDRLILHNVVLAPKSPPQKLCTSCVLLHYHKSCCAQCFEPYDANSLTLPPLTTATATTTGNHRLLPCMRCDNWSHLACPRPNIPKSPYICPPCMSPNYKYFDLKRPKNEAIDREASKQLLGAARIASITMSKAAAIARVEAERRAKEAALARKRASEAIDHVVAVSGKVEDAMRKEIVSANSGARGVNFTPRVSSVGDIEVKNGGGATVPVQVQNNGGGGAGQPVSK